MKVELPEIRPAERTPLVETLLGIIRQYMDRVAELAETYNHHPDILVHGWNKVKLSLSNHAAGGLTEIDFEMAARFDALLGQSEA